MKQKISRCGWRKHIVVVVVIIVILVRRAIIIFCHGAAPHGPGSGQTSRSTRWSELRRQGSTGEGTDWPSRQTSGSPSKLPIVKSHGLQDGMLAVQESGVGRFGGRPGTISRNGSSAKRARSEFVGRDGPFLRISFPAVIVAIIAAQWIDS
jgi:hypothetical protein